MSKRSYEEKLHRSLLRKIGRLQSKHWRLWKLTDIFRVPLILLAGIVVTLTGMVMLGFTMYVSIFGGLAIGTMALIGMLVALSVAFPVEKGQGARFPNMLVRVNTRALRRISAEHGANTRTFSALLRVRERSEGSVRDVRFLIKRMPDDAARLSIYQELQEQSGTSYLRMRVYGALEDHWRRLAQDAQYQRDGNQLANIGFENVSHFATLRDQEKRRHDTITARSEKLMKKYEDGEMNALRAAASRLLARESLERQAYGREIERAYATAVNSADALIELVAEQHASAKSMDALGLDR